MSLQKKKRRRRKRKKRKIKKGSGARLDLHIKLRQAQEMVRICAKYEENPLKEDFDRWLASEQTSTVGISSPDEQI